MRENIAEIAQQFHIRREIAELLWTRGVDTPSKIERFLAGGSRNFSDPFALSGMRESCERIKRAVEDKESIVIYGDYDADGICSVAILYLSLLKAGASVNWYIPEREEGYGINEDAIAYILQSYAPNLLITCDCGVSAHIEIDLILSHGVDVVVTDHHELPPILPRCLVVNPKRDSDESTQNLCGAGVALKVIEGVFGRDTAREYLDIATIATVADSVELLGENRDIVIEGLKILNTSPRAGIRALMLAAGVKEVGSGSLAFSVVPRINAAGRVGEAKRAMRLFSDTDPQAIASVVAELNSANLERQVLCEEMLYGLEHSAQFSMQIEKSILIFHDSKWQGGVVGIVASKLCERYKRPVFMFCDADGVYKGSGRSGGGVNLFNLLTSLSDLLVRFGGHSQAAGVSIRPEDFEIFQERATAYVNEQQMRPSEESYDLELDESDIDIHFAKDLMVLEPFGVGNRRPLFLVRSREVYSQPMKKHPEHLILKLKKFSVTAFHFESYADLFENDYEKRLILDISFSEYLGREYLKCLLKGIELAHEPALNTDILEWRYLAQLQYPSGHLPDCMVYQAIDQIKDGGNKLGTVFICFKERTYTAFLQTKYAQNLRNVVFNVLDTNNDSKVVLSPSQEMSFASASRVIFLDPPLCSAYLTHIQQTTKAELFIPDRLGKIEAEVKMDRETFGLYFRLLRQYGDRLPHESIPRTFALLSNYERDISLAQFGVCFSVFMELDLIALRDNLTISITGAKRELDESVLYRRVKRFVTPYKMSSYEEI